MPPRVLLLPGLYNSGPDHWQSHWEAREAGFQRLVQDDWETPALPDWVCRLDETVAATGPDVVLVAHSSSCALVAAWAGLPQRSVRGALLVAPSDPEGPAYPAGPRGFAPMSRRRLPFPGIVVASSNDEYVTLDRAAEFARSWGSRFVPVGPLGHINSASGLGDWPTGRALLEELLTGAAVAPD